MAEVLVLIDHNAGLVSRAAGELLTAARALGAVHAVAVVRAGEAEASRAVAAREIDLGRQRPRPRATLPRTCCERHVVNPYKATPRRELELTS